MQQRAKILAIGYTVRHIVCSGSRAGYEMYAADAIGDVDMKRCAKDYIPLNWDHADPKLLEGTIKAVDGVIIGSGFEGANFDFLTAEDNRRRSETVALSGGSQTSLWRWRNREFLLLYRNGIDSIC